MRAASQEGAVSFAPGAVCASIHNATALGHGCAPQPHTAGEASTNRSQSGGSGEAAAVIATAPPMLSPSTASTAPVWRARASAQAVTRSWRMASAPAPDAPVRRAAETALVVGVGRDAVSRQVRPR